MSDDTELIDLLAHPRFGEALSYGGEVLNRLDRALSARGEQTQWYRGRDYQGFYAHPHDDRDRRLYISWFPNAARHYHCSPFVAQLVGSRFEGAVLRGLESTDRVLDSRPLGWVEGPFIALELRRGLDREEQVEHLLEAIDAIRGEDARGGLSLVDASGGQVSVAAESGGRLSVSGDEEPDPAS